MENILLVLSTTSHSPRAVDVALAKAEEKKGKLIALFVADVKLPESIFERLEGTGIVGERPGQAVQDELMEEYPDLELAQFCKEAYSTADWSKGGVECIVRWLPEWASVVVAFRGTTKNYRDILSDMRGVPWYDKELGWCHAGFLKRIRSVWKEGLEDFILSAINLGYNMDGFERQLILTGHSLGAADATLAAALLVKEGHFVDLVTFGSPRVGFDLKVGYNRRWVCDFEPVPRHPWPIWGYRHIGHPLKMLGGADSYWHNHRIQRYINGLS